MALRIARHPPSANPNIWKACAGTSVEIPAVNSRVYYFPQGHAEQSSTPPLFSSSVFETPVVHCRILSVFLLASPDTDEVFAKILLQPQPFGFSIQVGSTSGVKKCEDEIKSFTKILTPSDANNGGGFSVPRDCADSIFPPLNYAKDPPVQKLELNDIHGKKWEFRHIYRGTPRRHLLTTGWSKFVNEKKLVAGDSVVFMRNNYGNLFIGVRRGERTTRTTGSMDCARWSFPYEPSSSGILKLEEELGNGDRFYSSSGEKVSADSVVEAAELARAGRPFEIVYYPATGSDFIVKAEIVEESRNIIWMAGMRVKMAVETERPPKVSHFQGTVSSVAIQDPKLWNWSPWRMLEVTWDEPEVMQNRKRVSPWQVELVAPTSTVQTPFPPTPGLAATSTVQTPFPPVAGLTDSVIRNMSQSLFSYDSLPVGMQGARQDSHCVSGLSNFLYSSIYQNHSDSLYGNEATKPSTSLYGSVATKATDDLYGNVTAKFTSGNIYGNVTTKSSCVSTELSIGSMPQYDDSTPDSQSSVHFFGNEHSDNHNCSPAAKSCSTPAISRDKTEKSDVHSFKLFGKIIQTNQPVKKGFGDLGCSEYDSHKRYKRIEGINNQPDPSSTCSSIKMSDGPDVPSK